MGDFSNVMWGIGVLQVDARDVGFLKNEVEVHHDFDIEDFKAADSGSTVLKLRGSVTKEESFTIKAGLAEINDDNTAMVLGGLPITTITSGTTVHASQLLTFSVPAGGGLEQISLGGVVNAFTSLKDTTDVTTYAAGSDYLVDPDRGVVYRNPSGAITSLESVHANWTETNVTANRVKFGTQFSLALVAVQYDAVSPITGKYRRAVMHQARCDGKMGWKGAETGWWIMDVTISAIPDPDGFPDEPMGYVEYEQ